MNFNVTRGLCSIHDVKLQSNYLQGGLKLPLNRASYTIYQRRLLCSLALKQSMLDNSVVCLSKEFHIPKDLCNSWVNERSRDREIHFKQRWFKSAQFQLRIMSGAEKKKPKKKCRVDTRKLSFLVWCLCQRVSKENENYFFTLFKSSLQASFFRRRVGIRAAFEVLLQIQDTDSDLPL